MTREAATVLSEVNIALKIIKQKLQVDQQTQSIYFVFSDIFNIKLANSDKTDNALTFVDITWKNNSFDPSVETVLSFQLYDQNTPHPVTFSNVTFNITASNYKENATATCRTYNPNSGCWENCTEAPKDLGNGTYQCLCSGENTDYSLLLSFMSLGPNDNNTHGVGGSFPIWAIILCAVIGLMVVTVIILMAVPRLRNFLMPYNSGRTRKIFDSIKRRSKQNMNEVQKSDIQK